MAGEVAAGGGEEVGEAGWVGEVVEVEKALMSAARCAMYSATQL